MFELASRNGVHLRHATVVELRRAYNFVDLQSFLNIYYEGARVLCKTRDFYDLTTAYFRKAAADNVRHAEIFFDPQTHTQRGIPFETVLEGLTAGLRDARSNNGMSALTDSLLSAGSVGGCGNGNA